MNTKKTALALLMCICLVFSGCSAAKDPLVALGEKAWKGANVSGSGFYISHLRYESTSIIESALGEDYQDYDWLPATGDIFIIWSSDGMKTDWYTVILDDSGNVCGKYDKTESDSVLACVETQYNSGDLSTDQIYDMLDMLYNGKFFIALNAWGISSLPDANNGVIADYKAGQWHNLSEEQAQQIMK